MYVPGWSTVVSAELQHPVSAVDYYQGLDKALCTDVHNLSSRSVGGLGGFGSGVARGVFSPMIVSSSEPHIHFVGLYRCSHLGEQISRLLVKLLEKGLLRFSSF